MFSELKSIVDLIRTAVSDFRKFKTDQEREEIILGILRTYFLLKDCVEDGEKLIAEAGNDPIARIKAMDAGERKKTLEEWYFTLRKQGIRLSNLQGYIFGQDHLAIINPELQDKLKRIIGYKMDNKVTLHGIGSNLFFIKLFPINYSEEEKAGLVSMMAGARENELLDLDKIAFEVSALRKSLDEYRAIVERLVSDKELLVLSKRARQETFIN